MHIRDIGWRLKGVSSLKKLGRNQIVLIADRLAIISGSSDGTHLVVVNAGILHLFTLRFDLTFVKTCIKFRHALIHCAEEFVGCIIELMELLILTLLLLGDPDLFAFFIGVLETSK